MNILRNLLYMLDAQQNNIKPLTPANLRPYGRLIHYPNKEKKGNVRNLWRIVLTDEKAKGWRIAYLILRDKRLHRLECHPNTFESFEPVKGKCLIFLSTKPETGKIDCFLLDKPIILNKSVWHGLIVIDKECEIKITENAKVQCKYFALKNKEKICL